MCPRILQLLVGLILFGHALFTSNPSPTALSDTNLSETSSDFILSTNSSSSNNARNLHNIDHQPPYVPHEFPFGFGFKHDAGDSSFLASLLIIASFLFLTILALLTIITYVICEENHWFEWKRPEVEYNKVHMVKPW